MVRLISRKKNIDNSKSTDEIKPTEEAKSNEVLEPTEEVISIEEPKSVEESKEINDNIPIDDHLPCEDNIPKNDHSSSIDDHKLAKDHKSKDNDIHTEDNRSIEDNKPINNYTSTENHNTVDDHTLTEGKKKKKKNKKKKKQGNENDSSEIVLVDVRRSRKNGIKCVKKDMHEEGLRYMAISYRWGELEEQLVQTPDYIVYVTSFHLLDLIHICRLIKQDPDLSDIHYIWIDAISINQHDPQSKKETILRMPDIYKNATFIVAIPDLNYRYLMKYTLNYEVMELVWKYSELIYDDMNFSVTNLFHNIDHLISNSTQSTNNQLNIILKKLKNNTIVKENDEIRKGIKRLEREIKINDTYKTKDEIERVYQFLAHLIDSWSSRTWVISEYQIAKEKYEQQGTPLKYLFMSLWTNNGTLDFKPFFCHDFIGLSNNGKKLSVMKSRNISYEDVTNGRELIDFIEAKFSQPNHLDMVLKSKATKNEDRFYAILPVWKKYQHVIKNKNTIADWNITDSLSVRLKLYEMFASDDLWNKARLLYSCTYYVGKPVLPTFATNFQTNLVCIEVDDTEFTSNLHIDYLLQFQVNVDGKHFKNAKEYITEYVMKSRTIFKQNLINIQFHQQTQLQQCHLTIKVKKYFLFNLPDSISTLFSDNELIEYSLEKSKHLELIYIPYFTYDIPLFDQLFPTNKKAHPILSGTLLLGDRAVNRWILMRICVIENVEKPKLHTINDNYVFNIY